MNTQTIDQTKAIAKMQLEIIARNKRALNKNQFLNIAYNLWVAVDIEYTEDYAAMVEGLMLRRDIRWVDNRDGLEDFSDEMATTNIKVSFSKFQDICEAFMDFSNTPMITL